jgi:hypothetical protein
MTNRIIVLLAATLLSGQVASSQQRLTARFSYGYYLHNTENDSRITMDDNFDWLTGVNFGYGHFLSPALLIDIQLTYKEGAAEEAMSFAMTSPSGPEITGYFYASDRLREYAVEVSLCYRFNDLVEVRAGPSGGMVDRIIRIDHFDFTDRLSAGALGGHAGANLLIPLGEQRGFILIAGLEFRYMHSIFFDARGRKLDDYSLEFFTVNLTAGMAFEF